MTVTTHPSGSSSGHGVSPLLDRLTLQTDGVLAAVVSSGGRVIASAGTTTAPGTDRLAWMTSAVAVLANDAARGCNLGDVDKVVIEVERGYVLVRAIGPGSALGVLATKDVDLAGVGYEMGLVTAKAAVMLDHGWTDLLAS
jgi:predicted regulator of Ras-like GTPase activity (Roadblock/LC7/MglB family)